MPASNATANSVQLSWSEPLTGTPPFNYQVQYRVAGTTSGWTDFGSIASTTVQTITGLAPATFYEFQIYARNASGDGPVSPIITHSTLPSAAVAILNGTDKSASLTTTSLTVVSTATIPGSVRSTTGRISGKYYFEVTVTNRTSTFALGIANIAYPLNLPAGLGNDANSFGYYPANNGACYIDGDQLTIGSSPNANGDIINVAVDLDARLLWVSSLVMRNAGFDWNNDNASDPATGAGGLSLDSLNPGPYYVAFSTSDLGTEASVNFGALPFDQTVPSDFLGWNTAQSEIAPGVTTSLVAGDLSPSRIGLSWTAPTTGSVPFTFQVQYRKTGITTWTNASVLSTVTSFVVSGLEAATSYDFRVHAINSAGNGTASSIVVEATAAAVLPTAATDLTASAVTASSVTLSWTAPTTGTEPFSFVPRYRLHGVLTWTTVASVRTTSAIISLLAANTSYDFSVLVTNSAGTSASSSIVTLSTNSSGTANPRVFTQNLNVPSAMNWLPDGSILLAQRNSFSLARVSANVITHIAIPTTVATQGTGGLLGLTIDPDFATNHYIYLCHTKTFDDEFTENGNEVIRYTLNVSANTIGSPLSLLTYGANSRNNGGCLNFGPDGKLYIATGDALVPSSAQDLTKLNGKILRINKDGTVPSDNPFNDDETRGSEYPNRTRSAVWSFGHSEPSGICWQDDTLWSTEHGPSGYEFGAYSDIVGNDKINLIVDGGNYGHPLTYGSGTAIDKFGHRTLPPALCSGDRESWSPCGICYSQGSLYFGTLGNDPNLQQRLGVNQTFVSGKSLSYAQTWFAKSYGRIRDVRIGPDGLMYFTSSNNDGYGTPLGNDDKIYQVAIPGVSVVTPGQATELSVTQTTSDSITLVWTPPTSGTAPFRFQVQFKPNSESSYLDYPVITAEPQQQITNLKANTAYNFRVVTTNLLSTGSASEVLTATTSSVVEPQMLPTGYLSTRGNQFVDPTTDEPVRIAAVAWAGADLRGGMPYGLWQIGYKTMLDAAKSAGFNAIRFQFCDQALDMSPGPLTDSATGVDTTLNPGIVAGMSTLQMWDKLFEYCAEIGLKVWLAKMGNVTDHTSSGLWYGDGGYSPATCAANLVSLASHYASNSTVIAIELNNAERAPNVTYEDDSDQDILKMWEDVGNAIHQVNPDIMIFCQAPSGDRTAADFLINGLSDLANLPRLPTLVVPNKLAIAVRNLPNSIVRRSHLIAPDLYAGLDYSHENFSRSFGFVFSDGHYPIVVSEMGYNRDGGNGGGFPPFDFEGDNEWLRKLVDYLDSEIGGVPANGYGPSWAWSRLNPSGPESGFSELPDAGRGIISYTDNRTVLDRPHTNLRPLFYYGPKT